MSSLFHDLQAGGLDLVWDVHARAVEYRPGANAAWRDVRGIYNPSHERADTDGNVPIMTQERILDLRAADIDFER